MKRSDMINRMADHWFGLLHINKLEVEEELYNDAKIKMDALLHMMENHGMKPPVEDVCPVIFKTTHVWEKEEKEDARP
jgi:hypothetical protein